MIYVEIANRDLAAGMITFKESRDGNMIRDEILVAKIGRCSQGIHFRVGTGAGRTVCYDNAGKATVAI